MRRSHPPILKPGPFANLGLRLLGLAVLTAAGALMRLLWLWQHQGPRPAEMVVAGAGVALFWLGNVLIVAGDHLLRPMPRPPRPLQ